MKKKIKPVMKKNHVLSVLWQAIIYIESVGTITIQDINELGCADAESIIKLLSIHYEGDLGFARAELDGCPVGFAVYLPGIKRCTECLKYKVIIGTDDCAGCRAFQFGSGQTSEEASVLRLRRLYRGKNKSRLVIVRGLYDASY